LLLNGVRASQPIAFIRAAPLRVDCKTVLWTDAAQFAARGDVGYVRATLAQRDEFFTVEADDVNAIHKFLWPRFTRCTSTITPVSEVPVPKD